MFEQTLKNKKNTYKDTVGFDMDQEEPKELPRDAYKDEELKRLYTDRSKDKSEGNF